MKSILVAVEPYDQLDALFETVYLFASRYGSYVEGISPRPVLTGFVGDANFVVDELHDPKLVEEEARAAFDDFMRRRAVPAPGGDKPAGPTFAWSEKADKLGASIGEAARAFDITFVGRSAAGGTAPFMSTVEPILFESGRPIIIAPPTPPKSIGRMAVIAWNGSTEAARATAFAMPLLKDAERVVVLTVQGGMVAGPDGAAAVRHLRRNGIQAEGMHLESGDRAPGEVILSQAIALGADLLIKGAYTQSRLRQMFFGGQTRYLLTSATVPLFMSH